MTTAFGARRRVDPLPSGPSMWDTSSGSRFCRWAFGNAGNAKCVVSLPTLTRRFADSSNGSASFSRLPFRCSCGPPRAMPILESSVGSSESPPRQEGFCFSSICFILRRRRHCAGNWPRLHPPPMRSAHFVQHLCSRAQARAGPAHSAALLGTRTRVTGLRQRGWIDSWTSLLGRILLAMCSSGLFQKSSG
jgi:hypothetical protein